MKLISKTIVLSSIVGISFYGFQQLRQSTASAPKNTTNTFVNDEINNLGKKKPGDNPVIEKKQDRVLTKPELMVFETDLDIELESNGQETTEIHDKGNSEVSFEDGLLNINADNVILAEVLVQIASEAGISIALEPVDPEQRITISLQNSPIDTALRELLAGYDYFFLYSSDHNRLQATWIYLAGTGKTIALSDHENRSGSIAEDDLYSSDSLSRVLALQQYASSDTQESVQHVKNAVDDEDPDVRAAAILIAQENAIELSVAALKELAESDPSPIVRSVALNTLSMNSELSPTQIAEFAEIALGDSNQAIREEAEAILEGLEALENKDSEASESQQLEVEV